MRADITVLSSMLFNKSLNKKRGTEMKKLVYLFISLLWIISSFLVQGCATDKSYARKDFSSLSPVKVIRYETPGIERSTKTETLLITTAVLAVPGGSALLLLNDKYCEARGKDMQEEIPDFGLLVMNNFVDKLRDEIPDFPALTVECTPVEADYNESSTLISFKVKKVAYGFMDPLHGSGNNFYSKTVVTMTDPQGNVIWQKNFLYLSENFNRAKEIEELEADNARLLKEEMHFAAEQTAADFIANLTSTISEPHMSQKHASQ
jgi:hypothetical protein